MKITFLSPAPDLSGGQRVIAVHADNLLSRGHDVTIVARARKPPSKVERLRYLAKGVPQQKPLVDTHFDLMQTRLIKLPHHGPITASDVPDADVVIATWWETAFETLHFPLSKGRKFYFIQHHEVHPHLPFHISGASYFLPLRKIAVSTWLVNELKKHYKDQEIELVPNGVDHNLFYAPKRIRQAVPTIGLQYSTTPFKGLNVAIEAIKIAQKRLGEVRILAFGTSKPTRQLPLPPGSKMHVQPSQETLPKIYGSCDVFISASHSEGFGLPILEAMSCRTPVVATRVGCATDVIKDGENGYAVDINDTEDLARRVIEVLSLDAENWHIMSEHAHKAAVGYNWSESGDLFEKAISGT